MSVANRPSTEEVQRWQSYLRAERDGAALYRALARRERNPERASIYAELARAEERHGARWAAKLREAGVEPEPWAPSLRTRVLMLAARLFGARSVAPVVLALERGDANMYAAEPEAPDFAREEETHGRVLRAVASGSVAGEIARLEPWHRGGGGGSLRAAIFGMNDGLVSNLSLVMGVAGADPGAGFVLLAGIAGLLAGAFSMAAGEYVSMRAQRELFERQIALERAEIEQWPEEEREELALIYRAKGVPRVEAERLAEALLRDPQAALDTLAREELGLDPEELGSPWGAAASSFVAFALGASVPVLPYLFVAGSAAFVLSAVLSALALGAVGAALSLFTGRSALYSGARMLLIGGAAAMVTYTVGRLIGVSVGG